MTGRVDMSAEVRRHTFEAVTPALLRLGRELSDALDMARAAAQAHERTTNEASLAGEDYDPAQDGYELFSDALHDLRDLTIPAERGWLDPDEREAFYARLKEQRGT